jgi:hypothetical protein
MKQAPIVLGGTQYARGDGDTGAMPGYRRTVPPLRRIVPIRVPRFVIDFHGPAMASDAGDPCGLPRQLVRDAVGRGSGERNLARLDDQTRRPNVMEARGLAIAVSALVGSFVGD